MFASLGNVVQEDSRYSLPIVSWKQFTRCHCESKEGKKGSGRPSHLIRRFGRQEMPFFGVASFPERVQPVIDYNNDFHPLTLLPQAVSLLWFPFFSGSLIQVTFHINMYNIITYIYTLEVNHHFKKWCFLLEDDKSLHQQMVVRKPTGQKNGGWTSPWFRTKGLAPLLPGKLRTLGDEAWRWWKELELELCIMKKMCRIYNEQVCIIYNIYVCIWIMILMYIIYIATNFNQPTKKPSTEHKWWRIRDLTPVKEALHYRDFLSRTTPKQWILFQVVHMGVSKNRGTPKWMVYNGKPYKMDNLGVPPFLETSISNSWTGNNFRSMFGREENGTKPPKTGRRFCIFQSSRIWLDD